MDKKRFFGELELAILRVFEGKKKLTVKEVLVALNGNDKYTTIMTVMNRMVAKKFLLRKKAGLQYEYWINSSDEPVYKSFVDRFKEKFFGGKAAPMVSYLLESSDEISDQELEQMEKKIQQLIDARKKP